MILFFIILGSFLLYAKSKYFNQELRKIHAFVSQSKWLTRILGYALLAISTYHLVELFDFATGLVVSFFTTTMMMCLMVLGLSLHKNFIYVFASSALIALLLDFGLPNFL
ncbi:MAG: hypothetical protein AAGJ18_23695 [Bacteroidota bacterium]